MYYDVLAERVRFFKESREGIAIMCKAIEDMREEALKIGMEHGRKEGMERGRKEGMERGRKEGIKMTVLRMLEAGKYALEEIAEISGLSLEDVKELQMHRL